MLSTEIPPPDLPCPCEISQLKSCSSKVSIDERASDSNQHRLEVDLLKSGLDDNNPLPKFSIRDYVSNTRGKDIKNSWPFSQKNLQLCLKNGVTDVLPPFQSLDSVRNPSRMKCAVNEDISNSDVKLSGSSGLSHTLLSIYSKNVGEKLAVDTENISSSGSDEKAEVPSTRSHSCYDINSVPQIKRPCLETEAVNLPRSSVDKPETPVPASHRVERNIQNPVKNCKLIVKLGKTAEPWSIEHLGVNTSAVSETMASKVCPVCKTFSSSSNTTLNAHIDQCLSGMSTIEWTSNSKIIKHRIKPRKTRLMVDIYAEAQRCTLEDLDRRNGTNWASNLGFQTQDLDACSEEKKMDSSDDVDEDNSEEGAVYVDSGGTKFLCLSKFSDLPSNSNAKDDCETWNLIKRDKEGKFPTSKKKKSLVKKHRLLKYPPYGQTICSPWHEHCPENRDLNCSQQRKIFLEEAYDEEGMTQPVKSYYQKKSDKLGMIKQWVGSKRTGLKKINLMPENQHPDKTIRNMRVKSSLLSHGDAGTKRTSDSKSPVFSGENPLLNSESHKRKENLPCHSHDEYMKHPSLRKRGGLLSSESRDCCGKKNHLALSKFAVKRSRKGGPSVGPSVPEHCTDSLNDIESHVSFRNNKRMEIDASPALNADSSFINSGMSHQHAFLSGGKESVNLRKISLDREVSSGGKKFSPWRTNLSSVMIGSVPTSKKRKHLNFKKPRLQYESESDEEEAVSRAPIDRRDSIVEKLSVNAVQMENVSGESSMKRTGVMKIQKKKGGFVKSGKVAAMAPKGTETSPESDSHVVSKDIDSFMVGSISAGTPNILDAVKEGEIGDEFVCEPISEQTDGEAFIVFSKSLDSALHGLAGPSDVECVSGHFIKSYNTHCPAELLLGGEPEIFCAEKVVKDAVTPNANEVAEMDSDEGQGNYFVDVDPIPIPGPPGSFLPSPGRMSSEELQGNSSLTTCRIQSSEDEHELVDMDSSDSPISSPSMVSESTAARSDSVSLVNLSVQSHDVHKETRCNISEDRTVPLVESCNPFEPTGCAEGKLNLDESRTNLMLPATSPLRFKNSQPCCCSRKEGAFQSDSLNYQDSQLLRWQTIASLPLPLPLPAQEKMGGDVNEKVSNFNLRLEALTEKEPTPEPEKIVANSPMGYAPVLVSHNSDTKFPTCGDCESPSPSTSNPILRLMGKNLMVMIKDENLSTQTRSSPSSMVNDHPSLVSCVNNDVSTVNFSNEQQSFHHTLSGAPFIFDHMQHGMLTRHIDSSSSNAFKTAGNVRIQGLSPHQSTVVLPSKSLGGSFTSSLEHHEFAGRCNLTPELGYKIGMDSLATYDIGKIQTLGRSQPIRTADSACYKHKEIIVIDELLGSEAGLSNKAAHDKAKMAVGEPTVGISTPMVLGYDPRQVNPFYSYQTRGNQLCNGSRLVHNANIQVPYSQGMNSNSVKWNCTLEGSSVLHPNSLTSSSPSAGRLRSSLYFSPGFS